MSSSCAFLDIANTRKKSVSIAVKGGRSRRMLTVPTPAIKKVVKKAAKKEEKSFEKRLVNNFSKMGLGKSIGDLIYPGVGGALGHAAETLFRTIAGQGEYVYSDIVAPSSMPANNTLFGVQAPMVRQAVDEVHWSGLATRIAHREYIGDVTMSAGFSVARYQISPTDGITFPWLSEIANKFMKWKLLGAAIEYVPTSANAVSGGVPAMGSVSIGVQYDAYSPSPTTLQQMLNWQGAVTGRPTDNLVCAVECDGGYTPTNPLYIQHPLLPTGPDLRLDIFGQFLVATMGTGTAYAGAGQLWITYDLQLIGSYVGLTAPLEAAEVSRPARKHEIANECKDSTGLTVEFPATCCCTCSKCEQL